MTSRGRSGGSKQKLLLVAFVGTLLVNLITGCTLAPTRLYEDREVVTRATQGILDRQIVLIDARPPFSAAAAPIPQAIPLQWRDFVRQQPPFENALVSDLFFHTRRLARMGIGPETPVIVIGLGDKGLGDEGRLAWTLKYMGVRDVKFMTVDEFKFPPQMNPVPDRTALPLWQPELASDLVIEPREFSEALKHGKKHFVVSASAIEGIKAQISLNWKELVVLSSAKRTEVLRQRFAKLGDPIVNKPESIVVVDVDGVQAAGITLWLREAGYSARCLCAGAKDVSIGR